MAETKKKLAGAALTTSFTTLYTVPADTIAEVTEIVLQCVRRGSKWKPYTEVTLAFVPDGGSPGMGNYILKAYRIKYGETKVIAMKGIIDAAGTIQGLAGNADAVNVYISGNEITADSQEIQEASPFIEFSFDGGSPPSAGDNTGKYGLCHTAGGAYVAGAVYYDNSAALAAVQVFKGMQIATSDAVSGTVSLNADSVYAAEAATAPYSWTLKGSATGVGGAFSIATKAAGTADPGALNWENMRDSQVLIEYSFDGGSPPSAGDNTGKYGLCHTAGGVYVAGDVYYDTGAALTAIKVFKGMQIVTLAAISGTVSMIEDGVYAAEAATAPYTWTLKRGKISTADLATWADVASGSDSVDRADLNTKMALIHAKLQALLDELQ